MQMVGPRGFEPRTNGYEPLFVIYYRILLIASDRVGRDLQTPGRRSPSGPETVICAVSRSHRRHRVMASSDLAAVRCLIGSLRADITGETVREQQRYIDSPSKGA